MKVSDSILMAVVLTISQLVSADAAPNDAPQTSKTDNRVIHLANIFGSGCVLQRDHNVNIWGTATPGNTITVEVKSQSVKAAVDSAGKWIAVLDPEPAGGPFTLSVSGAVGDRLVLNNVYFGDVWILTGQSNMFNLLQGLQSDRQVTPYYPKPLYRDDPSNDFDDVRYFIVSTTKSATPTEDLEVGDPWNRWQSDGLGHMSIVGYYFTRALKAYLDEHGLGDVPIGIIKCCRGATAAEEWISPEAIAAMNPPLFTEGRNDLVSGYYNGMTKHIQRYAIKGALWYQGENNSGPIERIEQYPQVMRTLIESWRKEWAIDFPFYYVQLAPHHEYVPAPTDDDIKGKGLNWAWVREAQAKTLAVPNTKMACIIDIGFQKNVHPPYKNIVGERLARIALADTYGFDLLTRGPTVSDVTYDSASVTISFDNVADGLRTQAVDAQLDSEEMADGFPAVSVSADELAGFALCGSDHKFFWAAEAKIVGKNQVRISNAANVPKPVAVRYAWQSYPRCNLFNSGGLPAEPFRTDTYEFGSSGG